MGTYMFTKSPKHCFPNEPSQLVCVDFRHRGGKKLLLSGRAYRISDSVRFKD